MYSGLGLGLGLEYREDYDGSTQGLRGFNPELRVSTTIWYNSKRLGLAYYYGYGLVKVLVLYIRTEQKAQADSNGRRVDFANFQTTYH